MCVFVCACLRACEIDLTGLVFVKFYKDYPKAICDITFMHFNYKFMGALIMYTLRESYYHSISAFIISMRYWGLLFLLKPANS